VPPCERRTLFSPSGFADPEDGGFRWVMRFLLFLVASLTGIGWLTING